MKPKAGPSLYYVTDKNIFDALNEHKVDSGTVSALFDRRNTIIGPCTPRQWLAEYFSRLGHDYYDHQSISQRLGIVPRRERITSIDVSGVPNAEALDQALQATKQRLEEHGDVVNIVKRDGSVLLHVQFTLIDYRRNEFNQRQVRDGTIEFQKTVAGYVVRNTQNEYINDVRDLALSKILTEEGAAIGKAAVSLYAYPDPKTRSLFFFDLFAGMNDYLLRDVTGVHVFKPNEFAEFDDVEDAHVERVTLRGRGLTRSDYLTSLNNDEYYVYRVAWRSKEKLGKGNEFDLEALFADPASCTGFSYIVLGIYDAEAGVVAKQRRAPTRHEVAVLSQVIEKRARELMEGLRSGGIGVDNAN